MEDLAYAAKLDSLAADIEACGSDHLKVGALTKSMRDEAEAIRNPPVEEPVADEADSTAVDLTDTPSVDEVA